MKKLLEKYNLFNDWLAVKLTYGVGSMNCAWLFLIWALLPTFFPAIQALVAYVSSDVLQLVLLSVIMVGSALLNRASELRAQQDHEAIMTEVTELKEMHTELHALLKKEGIDDGDQT